MRFLAVLFALCFGSAAFGQVYLSSPKVSRLDFAHSTVGTSTALAIASSSVGGNVSTWKICNDAVNTSTYLLVGKAVDVSTDGVMLDKGQCFECLACKGDTLKLMKIEGQAAANGYSVIQYRE